MTPAITNCFVDEDSDYPTHRPLVIEVVTKMLEATVKELQKPTNFAWLLNHKIEKEVEKEMVKKGEEKQKGNDKYEGKQEFTIRKKNLEILHKEMDEAMEKRKHRIRYAVSQRDTSMQ